MTPRQRGAGASDRAAAPVPATPAERPLRADARRNRARLLEVAEGVFATQGTSASTEEIARQAGVGIGTVFRHFPTKEALLEAVFVGRLRRLAEEARALAETTDPRGAFFVFFTRVVDQAATKNAFADALTEAGVDPRDAASEVGRELRDALGTLLAGAQRAGSVRADVGVPELIGLLIGTSRATEQAGDGEVRAGILRVVLDGLRPDPAARPPSAGPPAARAGESGATESGAAAG
ncbi:TetR/AcrR family transcriptional regulator [Allostreptomyces psammosilenae]|uniref:AcrR family transcriptional regulator n=1 Tax=Allostreptomyces psammosilenae TaxID=1892865 RepID=A0A853A200_9ACTN|nr:helix-turn-helix domain-containing protein [Allostreptomyces psammosilenae]NYI04542.1 AcrR family transcriptional regulator [Allostreptomyces psammosilenae]